MTYLWVNHQTMFKHKESYKHKLAKSLLAQWLREQDEKNDQCKVAQFEWRSSYGVHEELMFRSTSDPFHFENEDESGYPFFVPDITVFHKGSPKYLFEIYHKHNVPQHKTERIKKFFDGYHVELYEISANEILRHDSESVPTKLKCKQLL